MGISDKERSGRGGSPTGDQKIPSKVKKKVISPQAALPELSERRAQSGTQDNLSKLGSTRVYEDW